MPMIFSRCFIFVILLTIVSRGVNAQNNIPGFYRGGDLTYKPIDTLGSYEFTGGLYVKCPGLVSPNARLALFKASSVVGMPPEFMGFLSYVPSASYPISDTVFPRTQPVDIAGCSSASSIIKDVRRLVFKGVVILDTNQIIPTNGFTFFVPHQSEGILNPGPFNGGLPDREGFPAEPDNTLIPIGTPRLAVRMLPYNNLRPHLIRDASPAFYNDPNPLFIIDIPSSIDTVVIANMAVEPDNYDSISYHVGGPIFDFNLNPLVSVYDLNVEFNAQPPFNPVLGSLNVNPLNSEFQVRPRLLFSGLDLFNYYHYGIIVRSWKCGILVSEVFREFLTEVRLKPTLPNYYEGQKVPRFENQSRFLRDIYVGDTLGQLIYSNDPTPIGLPIGNNNTISVSIQSPLLDSLAAVGSGTPKPAVHSQFSQIPLAMPRVLDLPDKVTLLSGYPAGFGYMGIAPQAFRFAWIPTCDLSHGGTLCFTDVRQFQFLITASDYTGPLLGKQQRVFTVRVHNLPKLPSPSFHGVSVGDQNNSVKLFFTSNIDTNITALDPLDSLNYLYNNGSLSVPLGQKPRLLEIAKRRILRSFLAYQIYRATNPNGPWDLVGTELNPFANSFEDQDPALNLESQDYYYRILTLSGCFNNARFNTSVTLNTFGGDYLNYKAGPQGVLSWGDNGGQNASFLSDSVYIEDLIFPFVQWNFIKTLVQNPRPQIDSTLPFLFCNDSLYYRTGIADNGTGIPGQVYWSRRIKAKYILPDSMNIKFVSVDTSGVGDTVLVSWYANPDILRRYTDGRFSPGGAGASTIFRANEPDSSWRGFAGISASGPAFPAISISSADSCNNEGGGSQQDHRVINLEAVAEPCADRITLGWRAYEGWNDLEYHLVFRQGPNEQFVFLDTLTATATSYIDSDTSLILGRIYKYLVTAHNQRRFATFSNMDTALYAVPRPGYCYIEYVSVDTNTFSSLQIRFNLPDIASFGKAEIYRRTISDTVWKYVDTLSNPVILNVSSGDYKSFLYIDSSINPQVSSYEYRVLVYDQCLLLSDSSNNFKSLFISSLPSNNYLNRMNWSHSESFNGDVDAYQINRRVLGQSPVFNAHEGLDASTLNVSGDLIEYGDDVTLVPSGEGVFQYYIVAVEADNQFEFEGRAASNKIEIRQEPRVFYPNAFVPGLGDNNAIFQPALNFQQENDSTYFLQVINRWGKAVFESKNQSDGWNGNIMNKPGEEAPQDSYIYRLQFTGRNNQKYLIKGSILLIRK